MSLDSLGPSERPGTGSKLDVEDVDGCILCGSGKEFDDSMGDKQAQAIFALRAAWNDFPDRLQELGWEIEELLESDMLMYSFANTGGNRSETVHSIA